ncbi:copper homeostasis protein CutC [Sphingomonas sp. PAMC26645]|uniref:copper homeostasis protein CutC n=1 Tax=Sphingomonas sp. PAMC26645 TaxID=2565555 RepID=UPI001FF90637|nr:copper homeostasis protein CutC [Sphingomonas sp. PAMC26645]
MSVPEDMVRRTRPMLEVCVEDLHGIDAAIAGGADRIELCAALGVGGLTPPASLIRAAAASSQASGVPVHLLARPREGGFVYTPREQALIADDIRTAAEAGLAGIVIGALDADHRLDVPALAAWVAHAKSLGDARGRPLSLTLHRAFDLCRDMPEALESAVTLGFDRILTSGGAPKAIDGVAMLAALHQQAAGRIIVLAGSGVSPETLPTILATGVREVHASCRAPMTTAADPAELRFGFASPARAATNRDAVERLANMVAGHPTLE